MKGNKLINKIRGFLLFLLIKLSRPFWGHGIVSHWPFINRIYFSVFLRLIPSQDTISEIHGLKIIGQSNSSMTQRIVTLGEYEEETTKLFHEIIREGMTVLDLGANIGYYSLLAGSLIGTGKVFAFEPFPETFSLLRRNIQINGFTNITPINKAVSNLIGKQKFFSVNDPTSNSLFQKASGESTKTIEVDSITIDAFVYENKLTVDVVKMDIEGAEIQVLAGMNKTIINNPNIKIIAELSPRVLERCNCKPIDFLNEVFKYGFKILAIDDEKKTRTLVTLDNVEDIITSTYRRYPVPVNIYCDRNL